ncbi:MAG: toll/interleukin-1 receptor domain-containing protein, partial [Hymenobacter sp.]
MHEELNERRTIFISHALPEDIEVALWVAAKLRNEGYEVWCEVEQVHGGEHFWKTIEPLIRDKTVKFVFLASQASVKKQGVRMEWDFALGVARDYDLQDFIIPVNLDGVSPNSLMGLSGLAMIQFQASWAHGIKALLTKLHKDDVPKSTASTPLSAAHWYFHRFTSHNDALKKTENFYSNWVALPLPPRNLYFHRYSTDAQAKAVAAVLRESKQFPVVRHDTYIVTFEPTMPLLELSKSSTTLFEAAAVAPLERRVADTHLILTRRYDSKVFPQRQDASNLLVQFLQQAVHEFFVGRGLRTYQMSSKK